MSIPEITWAHVQEHAPEDGQRYEAIGGHVYVTPAPKTRHQRIAFKLAVALGRILEDPGYGLVFIAPYGLEFPSTGEGVQPDLFFVSPQDPAVVGDDWTRGAPELVIEILSPSTAGRDRTVKRDLYRTQGVSTYWIVDPEEACVEACDFAGTPPTSRIFQDRVPVRVAGLVVAELDLRPIFTSDSLHGSSG